MNLEESFAGKRVMITGGLGLIGRKLARKLLFLGADTVIVDSLIPDYGGNLFNVEGIKDRVRINIADVWDRNNMDYLVRGQHHIFN